MQYCSYYTQWVQLFSTNLIVFLIKSIGKKQCHIRLNRLLNQEENTPLIQNGPNLVHNISCRRQDGCVSHDKSYL